MRFNRQVQVDTVYIRGQADLRMADEEKHCCATFFLRSLPNKKVWNRFQRLLSFVYFGRLDYFVVEQGSVYSGREMKESAESCGFSLGKALIESLNASGTVERLSAVWRLAYERSGLNPIEIRVTVIA